MAASIHYSSEWRLYDARMIQSAAAAAAAAAAAERADRR